MDNLFAQYPKVPTFLHYGFEHIERLYAKDKKIIDGMKDDLAYWQKFHPKLVKCKDSETLMVYLLLESNGQCRRFMMNRIYARLSRVRQDEEMAEIKDMFPKAVFKSRGGRLWMAYGKGKA